MRPWVLHVDMDQFIAAVELLRRPELVGRPVIVGTSADPAQRAVVMTATYEARAHGIRSGMPLRTAHRKCPEAVILPVDHAHYEQASAVVMATLRAHSGATVETLGWDEAFVGITVEDPEAEARAIQAEVLAATDLHCSIGIGDTLVRAKTATEFGKPQGTFRLTRETWLDVMGERPTTALWGIGSRIAARLDSLGINTVRDLAAADVTLLQAEFGPTTGPHLRSLGAGEGRHTVDDTPWVARAHGHEQTFQRDLTEPGEVAAALQALAEAVVEDLRAEARACERVHLKVRFRPFWTVTRVRKLSAPTFDPTVIAATADTLLTALDQAGRPIRLLGVRGEMVPPPGGYDPPRTHGRRGSP